MNVNTYPILSLINSVKDLRVLSKNILPKLCNELREYLLDNISRTSGHFASGRSYRNNCCITLCIQYSI